MKVVPMTVEEAATSGFTHKINLKVADLANTSTSTLNQNLITLGAGAVVKGAAYAIRTAITGTSLTNIVLNLGDNGTTNVWTNAADIGYTSAVDYAITNTAKAFLTTSTLVAQIISTGTTMDAVSAGEIDIFFHIADLTKMVD